jgi:invasion protein IalB
VDEQSIQAMKSGNKIEFQAETTSGERYHIIISLDGFTAAYNEAKNTSLYGY